MHNEGANIAFADGHVKWLKIASLQGADTPNSPIHCTYSY